MLATYVGTSEKNDALVEGALTGIIGGLLIGIIFIAGFGALSAIIGLIFTKIGILAGTATLIVGIFVTAVIILVGEC